MSLRDKVAIVTGGASGFGAGIVEKFVEEGAKVVILDLNEQLGQQVATKTGSVFLRCDVTKRHDWEMALAKAESLSPNGLDVVVNNAGWTYMAKPTTEVTESEFDRVFNVNVKSIYMSTDVIIPYFKKRGKGGSFITISSTAALRPRPNLTWYNATKMMSIAMRSMATEFGPSNIRFNCVNPVAGNTPLLPSFGGGETLSEEKRQAFINTIPLGRLSEASDIANAVAFLASDGASFINGIDLPVCGGRCA